MAAKRSVVGFFASGKHQESGLKKVDLIVHGKMSFVFSTKYVKLDSSSKFYVISSIIFIVTHPCLNFNLEVTLS